MHEKGSDPDVKESLSMVLRHLLEVADGRALAVREMVEIMQGRGLQMMVILLCLPFLTPMTIPGISIPFGLAIFICGIRIAFGHKPWLPGFILDRKLSNHALERMVHYGCKFYGKVEKLVKPRMTYVLEGPGMLTVVGLTIALAGFLLSLPIPPPFPFTNTIPGFAIILLSLGLMERDGGLIIGGYVLTTIGCIYILLIGIMGKAGVTHLWRLVAGD